MDSIPWTDYSVVGYAAGIVILSLVVVILTVVYFLAQCSTCMNCGQNRSGCRCFVLIMLICGIALSVLGILLVNDNSTVDGIEKLFQKYWEADRVEKLVFWNTIQERLQCCGLHLASDWGANVPNSCCKADTISCTATNAYKEGCLDIITKYYQETLVVGLAALAGSCVVVCIIGIIIACAVNISCRGS